MKRLAIIAMLWAPIVAAQQYMLEVTPPSEEASPLIAYDVASAATSGGTKTVIYSGAAGQTLLPVDATPPVYLFARPKWAGVSGSEGAWSSYVYTGGIDQGIPYLVSAAINTAGNQITITWSESMVVNTGSPTLVDAGGNTITLSSIGGSGSSRTWTPSRTIYGADQLTLSYTQPGNGIEDAAGNDWPSLAGFAVTNGSTQGVSLTVTGLPTSTVWVSKQSATYGLAATTSLAAACKYGTNPATVTADGTEMTTSDDLAHTASVAVSPGYVHSYCFVCTSSALGVKTAPQCVTLFRRFF